MKIAITKSSLILFIVLLKVLTNYAKKPDTRGQISSPGLFLYSKLWHKPHVRDQMGRAVPCEGTSAVLVQWLSWQQWPAALLCFNAWISALLAAARASAVDAADLKNTSQHSQPLLSTRSELTCEEGNSYQLVLSWPGLISSEPWG